jgi:SAM-dependent methyltransferase
MGNNHDAGAAAAAGTAMTAGPPGSASLPPQARLLLMLSGARIASVVCAVAELGIADLLSDGALTAAQLAAAAVADPESMERLLRAAAATGLITALPDGRYAATDLSEPLRAGVPGSVRALVLYNAGSLVRRPWEELAYTVRTGKPAFDRVFGTSFFDYLRADQTAAESFDQAMSQMSAASSAIFLDQYDFTKHARLADVGGGRGYFLAEILRRGGATRGVLFERPDVAASAREVLQPQVTAGRAEVVAGDFFRAVPAGCDAYVLKNVLHDWADDDAVRVLAAIRAAMDPAAVLLICEHVLAPAGQWDHAALLDIDMMLRFGGRERTLDQWKSLLAKAGFQLCREPRPGTRAVLECRAG